MLTSFPSKRRTKPSVRTLMKPASATRSGACLWIACASPASNSSREENPLSSTTSAGISDCLANFSPAASARLLITAPMRAGNPARTIASILLPRPEMRMTTDFIRLFYRGRLSPSPSVGAAIGPTNSYAVSRANPLAFREDGIEMLDVVDDAPLGGTGRLDPPLPGLQPAHVAPGIDVVGPELDDVDRHHADVSQFDREAANSGLVELLLHVGEDQDGLLPRPGFVQEHRPLDEAAGDVGIGTAAHRLDECVDLVAEGTFLCVGLRGAAVEGDFRDDVLLAEAAASHPRHRERIPRLQRAEQVVDDDLGLVDFGRVGPRGVYQHVHRLDVAALVGAGGAARQQPEQRYDE